MVFDSKNNSKLQQPDQFILFQLDVVIKQGITIINNTVQLRNPSLLMILSRSSGAILLHLNLTLQQASHQVGEWGQRVIRWPLRSRSNCDWGFVPSREVSATKSGIINLTVLLGFVLILVASKWFRHRVGYYMPQCWRPLCLWQSGPCYCLPSRSTPGIHSGLYHFIFGAGTCFGMLPN